MKVDKSLSGPNWKNALQAILGKTRKNLDPVIIIRGDVPIRNFKLKRFLTNTQTTFTRLGVTCSVADCLMELLYRLDGACHNEGLSKIDVAFQLIVNCKISPEHRSLLVIDNCHYLMPDHLFYLLGLLMRLEKRVQFLFFFTEDNFKKWKTKYSKDKRIRFFLNSIALKYALLS